MSGEKSRDEQLETSLRRVHEALAKGVHSQSETLRALVLATSAHAMDRANRKLARRLEKRMRHEARRQARHETRHAAHEPHHSKAQGIVFAAMAGLLATLALTHLDSWWLIFVAFPFAMGAARNFSATSQKNPEPASLESQSGEQKLPAGDGKQISKAAETDPRQARVDAICDKLMNEIKNGPQIVRDIVRKPEETIQALRGTCHELMRREREIRAAITDEDGHRLQQEREQLQSRIAAEKDEVVRPRLESARQALDSQLAQRADLATAASRLEAEATRILYTLENLHAQVLRVRSADSASADVAGAGLRRSLEQLSSEIDSVAESLEAVNRDDAKGGISPVVPVSADAPASDSREREKA